MHVHRIRRTFIGQRIVDVDIVVIVFLVGAVYDRVPVHIAVRIAARVGFHPVTWSDQQRPFLCECVEPPEFSEQLISAKLAIVRKEATKTEDVRVIAHDPVSAPRTRIVVDAAIEKAFVVFVLDFG